MRISFLVLRLLLKRNPNVSHQVRKNPLSCLWLRVFDQVTPTVGDRFVGMFLPIACFAGVIQAQPSISEPPSISYFESIHQTVFANPYDHLPQYQVNRSQFDRGDENLLLNAAKRTLDSEADLIEFPTGQKLLQANGICFSGRWSVGASSPYSGLLKANVTVPTIVRASVSLSGTKQEDQRAFGLAIKLFPDMTDGHKIFTENIFVMHSLGGIQTRYVLDLSLDNEPELGALPPWTEWLTAYRLESDLEEADERVSGLKANARFRPIAQLAESDAGGRQVKTVNAPHWLKLVVSNAHPRVDRNDFRDELRVEHYPEQRITWNILAANYIAEGKAQAKWENIGVLELKHSVTSQNCDSKLHFKHPAIR